MCDKATTTGQQFCRLLNDLIPFDLLGDVLSEWGSRKGGGWRFEERKDQLEGKSYADGNVYKRLAVFSFDAAK